MHIKYAQSVVRSGMGKAGSYLLILIALIGIVGPLLTPDPTVESINVLEAPSAEHLLGTNEVGQDVAARLAAGARTSILVAIGVGVFSTFLSALFGISAALAGGIYEQTTMRFVDALLVIPSLILLILLSAFLQPALWGMILLISFLLWPGGARVLRSQTLSLKERPHVLASRTFGAGHVHIAVCHIVPDLSPLLVASFIHRARRAIFLEAGLAFIGITDPATISWGTMIRNALGFYYTPSWSWWLLPPGICLSVLILAFLFLGHSLETLLEPRLKHA
ncbi:MAG: ABC transporter permease [Candidatus Brocadiia bacterium]